MSEDAASACASCNSSSSRLSVASGGGDPGGEVDSSSTDMEISGSAGVCVGNGDGCSSSLATRNMLRYQIVELG